MEKVQNEENRKDGLESVSLESLYAYLRETSEQAKKRSEKLERENAEIKRQREKDYRELRESQEETARQIRETGRVVREVSRQLGSIGNSNGDIAEEYFQNAFRKNPQLNGEKYDTVTFNVTPMLEKGQTWAEYDIVLANKKSIAIIEIKYHLKKGDMKEELGEILNKIEKFKTFYPKYENYKFYLGIASLSFDKNIENIIQKAGIAVIKQVGDKMVINSENLKAF
jgi:hypothetical protein